MFDFVTQCSSGRLTMQRTDNKCVTQSQLWQVEFESSNCTSQRRRILHQAIIDCRKMCLFVILAQLCLTGVERSKTRDRVVSARCDDVNFYPSTVDFMRAATNNKAEREVETPFKGTASIFTLLLSLSLLPS